MNISRAKFENLCSDEFSKLIPLFKKVLDDGDIKKSEVNEIILVGGSTRIPKIQEIISTFFDGKKLNKKLHPDEAVAYGATIQAHYITKSDDDLEENILLLDVIPLSLGIETAGGVMTKLLDRNSSKPAKKEQIFSTNIDNQTLVTIKVYEGEREETKNNHLLGKFNLTGIPPVPRGVPQIKVIFSIDVNGILSINASDIATNKEESITILNSEHLSTNDIDEMIKKSIELKEFDIERKELIKCKEQLENIIYGLLKIQDEEINNIAQEAQSWMDEHDIDNTNIDEFQQKIHMIEGFTTPIIKKLYDIKTEDDDVKDQLISNKKEDEDTNAQENNEWVNNVSDNLA